MFVLQRVLCAGLILLQGAALWGQDCSNAMIEGRYGYRFFGYDLLDAEGNPGAFPLSGVGILVADGQGRFTQAGDIVNENGVVQDRDFTAGGITVTTAEGEQSIPTPPADVLYDVQADCRGSATVSIGGEVLFDLRFVVVNGGSQVWFTQKTPLEEVSAGEIMRIDPVPPGELGQILALLQRVAARLGLVP
jgi:hypothetical protein